MTGRVCESGLFVDLAFARRDSQMAVMYFSSCRPVFRSGFLWKIYHEGWSLSGSSSHPFPNRLGSMLPLEYLLCLFAKIRRNPGGRGMCNNEKSPDWGQSLFGRSCARAGVVRPLGASPERGLSPIRWIPFIFSPPPWGQPGRILVGWYCLFPLFQ